MAQSLGFDDLDLRDAQEAYEDDEDVFNFGAEVVAPPTAPSAPVAPSSSVAPSSPVAPSSSTAAGGASGGLLAGGSVVSGMTSHAEQLDVNNVEAWVCPVCGCTGFTVPLVALDHLALHEKEAATGTGGYDSAAAGAGAAPEVDYATAAGFVFDDDDLAAAAAAVGYDPSHVDAAEAEAATAEGCEKCGTVKVDDSFREAFGVVVCFKCKKADTDGAYALISRTTAKTELLVTDKEMASLGFILKDNPRNSRWGQMKLYMRKQVEAFAIARWGSEAKLVAERTRREAARFSKAAKKAKGGAKSKRFVLEPGGRKRSKVDKDLGAAKVAHEHTWGEEVQNKGTSMWEKKCTQCGLVQEFEKW